MGGPMWVDHLLRDEVLAINFSPFGNTYSDGESTLHFFISSKSIMKGDVGSLVRDIVFKGLHLPERYIQALASLHERYMQPSTGGNLLQIFIPKEKVDDFVYLCTKFGKPCGKHNCGPKFYDKKTNIPMTISRYLYEYTNNPRSFIITISCNFKSISRTVTSSTDLTIPNIIPFTEIYSRSRT